MKQYRKKIISWSIAILMVVSLLPMTIFAEDLQTTEEAVSEEETVLETAVLSEEKGISFKKGDVVSGSFPIVEEMEIATVRYYLDSEKSDYAFAEFSFNESSGVYDYSFSAPYDGFVVEEGSSLAPSSSATIIAEYYSLTKWDGAVDTSWYNEEDTDFYLYNSAQLAGLAAIVNGSVDGTICDYQVRGYRSSPDDRSVNRGLPDVVEATYYEKTNLIAGVVDEAWKGVMKHDFANRTIHIMKDMDMGGVDGSLIDHSINAAHNSYDYPNWTPIGGEYLMDVSKGSSMIIAFFNGTIEGHGHAIKNLYCYRWSYPSVGATAYGYAQGTGLVGVMGALYDDDRGKEEQPEIMPSIRNLSLSGYVYGRRMVGGFVGCIGGGSNAAAGTSTESGLSFENLANHAWVYCTDSKGLGGIVACSMARGSIINCYNTGYMCANYAAPTGGIIGANEQMNVFCCYNIGRINTNGNDRGRGIGGDSGGSNYTVDDCYYLEGVNDCQEYPGYYTYNLPPSVSVHVTEMTNEQMTNGTLLKALNVNGTAYVAGDDGYPVLYWEKCSGAGSVTIAEAEGGTITAEQNGELANGTVVYLSNIAEPGYNFRYYTRNGNVLSGNYVMVDGETEVSGYFESAKAGILKINQNRVCTISVKKNGTIINEAGEVETVMNYPVNAGDSIYEGDLLIVEAAIKDGEVPDDPSMQYSWTADLPVSFNYEYSYTGGETTTTTAQTYKVGSEINGEDVSLTLNVVPLTTQKLWSYIGDTSWYNETDTVFTLTTAQELAGLAVLVKGGNTFEGKTILLGNDISLANPDGSGGIRYWDGIGINSSSAFFAGTFDGQDHKVTEMSANSGGLFRYFGKYPVSDVPSENAALKNLSVYGTSFGTDASGIVSRMKYADLQNLNAFVKINATGGYSGGIAGYVYTGCTIEHCFNYGKMESKGRVGGLAGELSSGSIITDSVNFGDVLCPDIGGNSVGGLIGSLSGIIEHCANYGNVTAYGRNIGGIAGQSVSKAASISGCYSIGTVTYEKGKESTDSLGGIVGFGSYYQIKNSFNYGDVVAKTTPSGGHIGGIIGRDGRQSTSSTYQVIYLDSACAYAEESIAADHLPDTTYAAGMKTADAASFASASGVLSDINADGVFVLTNGQYPEFQMIAESHTHSGGTASCSAYAICETCGLEYGDYDPDNHSDVITTNASIPVWTTNGYTGDVICRGCGTILEEGSVILADTDREALTVNYSRNGEIVKTRTYTVKQLDALKVSAPAIGYSYGSKSTEIMAATEYVTIEKLLLQDGFSYGNTESFVIICDGSISTFSTETLQECVYYYDADGNASDAPAALCFCYTSLSGSLEQVAAEAKPNNSIRFGYGLSEQQHAEQADVGGKRLVSPVTQIDITLKDSAGYSVSGTIGGYAGDGEVMISLMKEGESESMYSFSGTGEYLFSNVQPGIYTMTVSADGMYVERQYPITIESTDVVQDVAIYQLGDVNMNGKVNAGDVTHLGRHVARINLIEDAYALLLADTNGNGKINAGDVTTLARYVAKIIDTMP